jgi:ribosomal protein S18 acetylase RimI-like enzyme
MADFKVIHGLPAGHERTAAELYWQAFGQKIGKLLGPETRGVAFFEETINPSAIFAALSQDGTLLGVSAVQIDGKGFTDAGVSDLFKHYSLGALWRMIPLAMLERSAPPDTLQMDGICVSAQARGMGVGTALLEAVFQCARDKSLSKVTLDVINTNPRAKALYERRGFVAVSEESTSILKPLLGFDSATRMVKSV